MAAPRWFGSRWFRARAFAARWWAGVPAPVVPPPAAPPAAGGGFVLDPYWGQPKEPKRERKKRRKVRLAAIELPEDVTPWDAQDTLRRQIEEEDEMLLGIGELNLFGG